MSPSDLLRRKLLDSSRSPSAPSVPSQIRPASPPACASTSSTLQAEQPYPLDTDSAPHRPLPPSNRSPSAPSVPFKVRSPSPLARASPLPTPQAEQRHPSGTGSAPRPDLNSLNFIDLTLSDEEDVGSDNAATKEVVAPPAIPLSRFMPTDETEKARRRSALLALPPVQNWPAGVADVEVPPVSEPSYARMDVDSSSSTVGQTSGESPSGTKMELDETPSSLLLPRQQQDGPIPVVPVLDRPVEPALLSASLQDISGNSIKQPEPVQPPDQQSDGSHVASNMGSLNELDRRRSYDDELYDLEYIDDPPPVSEDPTPPESIRSESEEAAVEALVAAPKSVSSEPPLRSKSKDSERASDDEGSSSGHVPSPEPFQRRASSRRSSQSSADPLDLFEVDLNADNAMLDPGSPLYDSDTSMDNYTAPKEFTTSNYPVTTWKSYRADLSNFTPRVYYAKDLVSEMHNYINALDPHTRSSPHMRHVFEAAIRENTAEDEPNAPWIDVINEVDDDPTPPWEFYYTNRIYYGEGVDPPDITQLTGCDCIGKCDPKSKTCACLQKQAPFLEDFVPPGFAYDNKGRLRTPGTPIFECNSLCRCDDEECKNRVVQRGRKCAIKIKKTIDKGWGVFATKKIPKGEYIGLYSGEMLKDETSELRGLVYDKSGRTYLLDVDFYYLKKDKDWDNKYVVDAYHAGNFTRFLNNSCDPNCKVHPCYIDEPDLEKPLFTLFAAREIAVDEELCFSYKGRDASDEEEDVDAKGQGHSIVNVCRCGAANCDGFMFG